MTVLWLHKPWTLYPSYVRPPTKLFLLTSSVIYSSDNSHILDQLHHWIGNVNFVGVIRCCFYLTSHQKVRKKLFFFSPNVSTTPRRSSSVAIVQYSTSTDTYRYMHKQQIERRRPGSFGYEREVWLWASVKHSRWIISPVPSNTGPLQLLSVFVCCKAMKTGGSDGLGT